eukprot:1146856-Pelagomonas_calceolata.AAC.3
MPGQVGVRHDTPQAEADQHTSVPLGILENLGPMSHPQNGISRTGTCSLHAYDLHWPTSP